MVYYNARKRLLICLRKCLCCSYTTTVFPYTYPALTPTYANWFSLVLKAVATRLEAIAQKEAKACS